LPRRVVGIISRPRPTLARIVTTPTWVPVLVATFLIIASLLLAFAVTDVGRQAFVDQWERSRLAFGQSLDDTEYARMEARSASLAPLYALGSALVTVLIPFIVAGTVRLALRPTEGATPSFGQVLAVLSHANVVLALRQVVATPVAFVRESLSSATTVVQLVPSLDETSPLARFFGGVDLFVVWWIVVAALGLSILYRRPARQLVASMTLAYLVLAAMAAIGMAVVGGSA
jgi:hypothetical protein